MRKAIAWTIIIVLAVVASVFIGNKLNNKENTQKMAVEAPFSVVNLTAYDCLPIGQTTKGEIKSAILDGFAKAGKPSNGVVLSLGVNSESMWYVVYHNGELVKAFAAPLPRDAKKATIVVRMLREDTLPEGIRLVALYPHEIMFV